MGSLAKSYWKQGGVAASLVLVAGMSTAADAPTGARPDVHAFVLSNIWFASPGEPANALPLNDGGVEIFYKSLSPEEQAKYATSDKRQALEQEMARRLGFKIAAPGRSKTPAGIVPGAMLTPEQALEIGALNGFPKGRGKPTYQNRTAAYTSCTNPEDFPALAEGFRTYDGPVAMGMNLDGKVTREDFVGPNGEKGVDNQLWRAFGRVKVFRESGNEAIAKKSFMSMGAPTIVEISDVDDMRNDPQVTVKVYASSDAVTRDPRGQALQRVSYTIIPDRQLQSTTTGSIRDGVLMTEPVDLLLQYKEQIVDSPREIRAARIRAEIREDGSIEGELMGYYSLASIWDLIEQMTQAGANSNQISCPGLRRALDEVADGYMDPKTKKYTAISAAMKFVGVRAFAVMPEQRTAELGS